MAGHSAQGMGQGRNVGDERGARGRGSERGMDAGRERGSGGLVGGERV